MGSSATSTKRSVRGILRLTDANRCFLPEQDQIVVASLMRTFPQDFLDAVDGAPVKVRGLMPPKLVDVADGKQVYDEHWRLKQPNWAYEDFWHGGRRLPHRVAGSLAKEVGGPERHERIGILGGTFDPPHIGHLVVASHVRAELDLDRVLLVVADRPWQKVGKRVVSPSSVRLAMVAASVAGVPGLGGVGPGDPTGW